MKRAWFVEVVLFLQVLITPRCWIRASAYSKKWDKRLSLLLENGNHFAWRDKYTARLCNEDVWIENHPYASFSPYYRSSIIYGSNVLPSRRTVLYAMMRYKLDTFQ